MGNKGPDSIRDRPRSGGRRIGWENLRYRRFFRWLTSFDG